MKFLKWWFIKQPSKFSMIHYNLSHWCMMPDIPGLKINYIACKLALNLISIEAQRKIMLVNIKTMVHKCFKRRSKHDPIAQTTYASPKCDVCSINVQSHNTVKQDLIAFTNEGELLQWHSKRLGWKMSVRPWWRPVICFI